MRGMFFVAALCAVLAGCASSGDRSAEQAQTDQFVRAVVDQQAP